MVYEGTHDCLSGVRSACGTLISNLIINTIVPFIGVRNMHALWLKYFHAISRSVLTGALLIFLCVPSSSNAAKAKPSFFNSKETESTNLKPFKKWNDALYRFSKEKAAQAKGGCKSTKLTKCHYNNWMTYIGKQKGKDKLTLIKEINARMNKAKYISDSNNWGQKDFWATPSEFMAKFGDCEDYAIIKYISLRMLGFKENEIRVVAVKDLNLKVGHAILVAFVDGKTYVLDNQIKQVVEASTVRHYQPVFSIGTKTWWRHRV